MPSELSNFGGQRSETMHLEPKEGDVLDQRKHLSNACARKDRVFVQVAFENLLHAFTMEKETFQTSKG